MATADFLSGLPPDVMARVLRSGQAGGEEELLRQRQRRAQMLQQQSMPAYTNPLAAALGGLAHVAGMGLGAYQEHQAIEGLAALGQQRGEGRQAILDAYTGGMRQQQATAPDVIAPNIGMPDATSEQQAMAAALRGEQQREAEQGVRQGTAYLGYLSGDPGLRDFSRALLQPSGGDDLQALRLEQSGERLRLLSENSKRQNELAERRLTLFENNAKARRESADVQAAAKKTADTLKLEEGLRKEINGNPVAIDYFKAQVAFDKVQNAARLGTGAGDVALVFNLMKTLDPGSTVNSGEQASAQNTTNVPGQIMNTYNRLLTGERLSPEQRQEFVRAASTAVTAAEGGYRRLVDAYRGIAQRAGADFPDVAPLGVGSGVTLAAPQATPRATQATGDIDLNAPPTTLVLPDGRRAKRNPDGTYTTE